MNYKKLLEKITHKDFNGGSFPYCSCQVNVTMGSDSMNIHITKGKHLITDFDFTFEIPRDLVFHNMCQRTSNCITRNLRIIYNCKMSVYYES